MEWAKLLDPNSGAFLQSDELTAVVYQTGIERNRPVITYCQAGVRAAHVAFVLEMLGYNNVSVYDGSIREWSNDASLPLSRF